VSAPAGTWGLSSGEEIAPGRVAMELLGTGLRYETYLAWDEHLRALVVAKLVRPGLVGEPSAMRGIEAEARHLDRLAHPMLLRSFGTHLDGARPHLVLEHIEGPRLSTLIRRFGVVVEQLLPLALNLCAVLSYMSRERVVHLDVKPSNVIMAGAPRLIDLSVARHFDDLGRLTSPVGTDAYMAPEQCEQLRFHEIGSPADVWGLGATLYEALAREHPFHDDGERFPQLRGLPAPLPDSVPAALCELVMPCLAETPAERPTAAELADAFEPLVDSLPAPKIGRFRPGGSQMMRALENG
jgi:eukaryotic-like serine/threonine-protein kinase